MSDFGSPFATAQTHTYKLTEPLTISSINDEGQLVETDVDYAKVFDVPGETAAGYWIRLRLPTSRADNAALQELGDTINPAFRRGAFLKLCEAWSVDPEVTGNDYDRLQAWVYTWIDACVLDAMSRGISSRAEKKSGGPSSRKTSRARSTAAAA